MCKIILSLPEGLTDAAWESSNKKMLVRFQVLTAQEDAFSPKHETVFYDLYYRLLHSHLCRYSEYK